MRIRIECKLDQEPVVTDLDTGKTIEGINYLVWERIPGPEGNRLLMGVIPEEVLIEHPAVDATVGESAPALLK
jgi:hypothetical protein